MFKKILIANRGEIAVRIIRACREMGIATVGVFSEADEKALHVLYADEAVSLGATPATRSYLNIDKLIAAAKATRAEAIHPGYGFLSENADFAKRCGDAGITFIGPPESVIRSLGDKTTARRIMMESGVPVIPGSAQAADPGELAAEADRIGYPVMLKAAGGGGGKGMRVVSSRQELEGAFKRASSEALAAFGNGAVYLEKYLPAPRHVEFQILADAYGNVVHLLERECSIQRRHQKIIEETPSPALTPELREQMGQAAVAAARASGYVNAGTVEFLLDSDGSFYFLEVNTRLQVEHPITEMVTGTDLVRRQIEIAHGKPLDLTQADVVGRGHAIECRVYAEDPENHFFPSPGKILYLHEPRGPGVRIDSGVYPTYTVPVAYDPILCKLIVWDEAREPAINRMIAALLDFVVLGIKTSIPFLLKILHSERFLEGNVDTRFIENQLIHTLPVSRYTENAGLVFVADEITRNPRTRSLTPAESRPPTPWQSLGDWRLTQ
jgi:acetyl-CoA carboxylase biotin carboxylase subunit